jgi:hypothetical protein
LRADGGGGEREEGDAERLLFRPLLCRLSLCRWLRLRCRAREREGEGEGDGDEDAEEEDDPEAGERDRRRLLRLRLSLLLLPGCSPPSLLVLTGSASRRVRSRSMKRRRGDDAELQL